MLDAAHASSMFRGRLRKRGAEGVTKKGPLIAKHPSPPAPSPSSSPTPSPPGVLQASPQHSPQSKIRGASPSIPVPVPRTRRVGLGCTSPDPSQESVTPSSPKCSPVRRIFGEGSPHTAARVSSRIRPASPSEKPSIPVYRRNGSPSSPIKTHSRLTTPNSPSNVPQSPGGSIPRRQSPVSSGKESGSSPVYDRRAESPTNGSSIPRKIKYVVNQHNGTGNNVRPSNLSLANKETGNADLIYQQPSTRTNASPTRNNNYSPSTNKNYNQPRGPSPNSKIGVYQRYNSVSPAKDKRQPDQSNHPSGIPRREPSPTQPSQSTSSTPRGISPNSAISAASSMSNIHRNPSPGNGNRGTSPRGASPGSRCSSSSGVSDEVIRGRVRRAVRARLYLLHQPGPNSFSVGGDSPSHKYKVIIGPQSCSCGHSPYCVHVLFVMVRVLQVPENSSVLLAGTLKDYEVEQLLSAWEERRKKAVRAHERRSEGSSLPSPHGSSSRDRSGSSSSSPNQAGHSPCGGAEGGGAKRGVTVSEEQRSSQDDGSGEEEEAQCPICLTVMVEGESLVACETGCRNLLHHHCMAVWAADRHSQKLPLLCPLCRAPWPSKGPKQKPQRENPDSSLFGSRSALSAASHTRFPSTPTESSNIIAVNHRRAFSADETPMQESGYGTVGGLLPASSVNMNSININIVNSSREINNSINSNFDTNHNSGSGRPSLSSRHLHNQMQNSRASPVQTNSKSAPLMRRKERRDVENRNLNSGSSRAGGRESPSNSRPFNPIPRQHNQSPSRLSPSIPTSRNSAYRNNSRNTRFTPLDIGNSFSVVNSRNINSRNGNESNPSAKSRIPSSPSSSISSNRNNNRPNYTNLSNPILTNTNQASSANSRQPLSKRMSPTPGMVVPVGVLPGAYYPPTLRGEVSAAMVANVGEDEVPLPRSEPIPVEHEESAATWVAVFGRELVGCLFSRDWAVRETGLRRLAHEVVKVLHWDQLVTGEETRKKVVHCCANILAQVVNDPVYKVYLACLRVVRCLLSHLTLSLPGEVSWLQELLRPLLHTLLLKCADGNRRTSQISVDSLLELSRGQEGELALGGGQGLSLGGVQYVLSCILDEAPPQEAPWQWLLGRLCVLDRLLDQFPQQFQIQMVSLQPLESGYKLQHYDRLMTVVEFAFKALGSSHATVAKLARRVYICGAKMAAAEPNVFRHVCDMLGKLDISLQMRLKRRLRSLHSQHVRPVIGRLSDNPLHKPRSQLESNLISTALPRLVRSVSHSPSRLLAKTRSPSNSPCRNIVQQDPAPNIYLPNSQLPVPSFDARNADQPIASTSTANTHDVEQGDLAKAPDDVTSLDQVKQSPPRPNHLPLDSIHLKFKDKQAKVKQYHKSRPRQEEPIIVQHALITPKQYRNSKPPGSDSKQDSQSQSKDSNGQSKKKNQSGLPLRKGGLSQSHGNNLDLSPRTPVGHPLPKFTLKEAIASPSTPDPPFTTPVKEVMHPVLPQQLQSQIDNLCTSEMGAGSDEPPEIPLPKIPNLTLIPPYLEHDVAGSQERIAEAPCLYEENVEWKRGQMLGSGAFSCCYQARDIATGSLMAVKVVSFVCNSSEEQERVEAAVEDEILLMSQLRHRNIVRLFGSVRYSTSFCVFTEWMAGGSVSNLLEKYGAFSEAVILRYTKQVLMGLSYLHDNMILHRDLKGANLLIDSTGDWLRIGDFGTAARLAHKSTIAGEFQGQLLGTIAFMAPEVLRGDNYGRACDIWSVGCCIIEMASTKPPWDADHVSNQFKLMFKIATSNGPPMVPEQLSESMRTMVLNCLQTLSDNRPSSKDLLGSDLFASIKISAN